MRSLPLYTHMDSSAVGPRDMLGEEDPHLQHMHLNSFKGSFKNPQSPPSKQYQSVVSKPPLLRRTRSDTSSMVVSDLLSKAERSRVAYTKPVSINSETTPTTLGHHTTTTDSDDNKSSYETPNIPRERYDSFELDFVDQLSENYDVMPPRSKRYDESLYPSYHHSRKTPRRTPKPPPRDYDRGSNRASPYLSRSNIVARSNILASTPLRSNIVGSTPIRSNMVASSPMRSNIVRSTPIRSNYRSTPMRSNLAGRLILTESELVPSSSEVANKKAKERSQANDTESSILSQWSLEDDRNIECLRSKLERWRTELPPLYDLGSSHQSSDVGREIVPVSANGGGGKSSRRKAPTVKKKKKHNRRHTEGGNGLFSCFSNLCGVECTFVCGGGSDHDGSKKKGGSKRLPPPLMI
ncbi:unnamed protein product [Brassica oleracea]